MRKKLASFFGMAAFWAFLILGGCIVFLPYVGVYITYVCLPVGIIGTFFWYLLSEKEDR
ncbi:MULTISPECIES: hypothetical protein [unclassified Pasteurella]|uniref:hypothetical protein n=1 Tax=unclassified Pasteurella TaxID=2621516 RepID=UPI001430AC18|nr:hypothetical protein [Pasteurella sp. 19428wF3_WM03]